MAELYFFRDQENVTKQGKIIGTSGNEKDRQASSLFDNDPNTGFHTFQPSGCWGGLDFGEPIEISRILYMPTCDGNGIALGDEYELFYWENHKWNSIGKQKAESISLSFDNCPTGALFLLHNHTRGKEERIFTYEDEKQIWW